MPSEAGTRRWRALVWAVAGALGALLIAIILGPHKVGDYFTETDFYGAYAAGAQALRAGHLDPSRYGVIGPLYEMVLAMVGLVVPDLFVAAELISIGSALAAVLLLARLLQHRANARLALAAVLFLATNGTFVRYGFSATTDALALALEFGALCVLMTAGSTRAAAVAGLIAALAFLTRYSNVVLLPAGLLAIALGGTRLARRPASALVFTLGFAAPVLPWLAFSMTHGGSFASQLHHNIAYDVFARPQGMVWDDYQRTLQPQFHSLADVIARDPMAVAMRELSNVFEHLKLDGALLLGWPVAWSAIGGALLLALDGVGVALWPLWAAAALAFLALVPAFHSARYSLAMLPAYATLAGALFASHRLALPRLGGRLWLKAPLIALPLILTIGATRNELTRVFDQLPREALTAGYTLRALRAPGDRVLARKPHVAWLGDATLVAFPPMDSLPELARVAREQHVRWLFFSWPEAELRPAFAWLLDSAAQVPGLTVRYAAPTRPAILYEIGPEFGTVPAWMRSDTLLVYHRSRARLAINPDDVRALWAVGFVDASNGRDARARPLLERAARLDPNNAPGLVLLGETALRMDDVPAAAAAFERAATLDPGSARAQLGLGWVMLRTGHPEDAARRWRPLLSLTRDPATLERMETLFHSLGDSVGAALARTSLDAQRESH